MGIITELGKLIKAEAQMVKCNYFMMQSKRHRIKREKHCFKRGVYNLKIRELQEFFKADKKDAEEQLNKTPHGRGLLKKRRGR